MNVIASGCLNKKKRRLVASFTLKKDKSTSDWIYVIMASVSVYRFSAKNDLGTKNFTLPTQDTG